MRLKGNTGRTRDWKVFARNGRLDEKRPEAAVAEYVVPNIYLFSLVK